MKHDDNGANFVPFHVHEGPGVVTFIDMEGRGVGARAGGGHRGGELASPECQLCEVVAVLEVGVVAPGPRPEAISH